MSIGIIASSRVRFAEGISVNPENKTLNFSSQSYEIEVISETNFTVSDNAGWTTISPETGLANTVVTITVTLTENMTPTSRQAIIAFNNGQESNNHELNQSAK